MAQQRYEIGIEMDQWESGKGTAFSVWSFINGQAYSVAAV